MIVAAFARRRSGVRLPCGPPCHLTILSAWLTMAAGALKRTAAADALPTRRLTAVQHHCPERGTNTRQKLGICSTIASDWLPLISSEARFLNLVSPVRFQPGPPPRRRARHSPGPEAAWIGAALRDFVAPATARMGAVTSALRDCALRVRGGTSRRQRWTCDRRTTSRPPRQRVREDSTKRRQAWTRLAAEPSMSVRTGGS